MTQYGNAQVEQAESVADCEYARPQLGLVDRITVILYVDPCNFSMPIFLHRAPPMV